MSDNALPLLLGMGTAGGLLWYASQRKAHARTLGEPTESRVETAASVASATERPARDPDRASPPATPATNAPTASAPPASAPSGTRPPERATPGAAAESTPSPLPGRWIWPVEVYQGRRSVITNPWSTREGHIHKGVDIMFPRVSGDTVSKGHPRYVVPAGVRALAASDGVVWSASRMPRGFTVVIDHSPLGFATFYTHLSKLFVAPTQRAASRERVYAGQPIGIIGADPLDPAGLPHLHFELWKGGPADAIDPAPLMRWWEHISPPPTPSPTVTISTAPRPVATAVEPLRGQSLSALGLDFGRPVPVDVRAIMGSGWANPRGTGPTRRLHRAIDIGLPIGTPILAVDRGVVTHVQSQDIGDAGIWAAVRHPSGITARYIHLSRTLVKVGQLVERSERLGLSGDTGSPGMPHLHLDLRAPAEMLPIIEAAIGRPRSGWGSEMKPFGYSIPGEPLIPVDAYREIVRTQAAEMGIPLRDPSLPRNDTGARNASLSYRPVGQRGEPYPEWVRALDGKSGVYVIRELEPDGKPEIVYVGQSSANRLYDTLTRHFQTWKRSKRFWSGMYGGQGHDPGLTYNRDRVDVAVRITPASQALDEEARLIRRLRPRDNLIGQPEEEEVPF